MNVTRWRKKPKVVEAMQYSKTEDFHDIREWVEAFGGRVCAMQSRVSGEVVFVIQTLEGEMIVRRGDWVIKGVAGEFYPCKPDIFARTYEEVS